jgi:hypothetical protein
MCYVPPVSSYLDSRHYHCLPWKNTIILVEMFCASKLARNTADIY